MGNSVILEVGRGGVSILTELDHRFSDRQVDVVSDHVAQIMASRQERIVYVLGDPAVTYGDVAMLVARLNRSITDLNVVLVSQADVDGVQSGLCLDVRVSQPHGSRS